MLHDEWINYLKRESNSKNFDQIKNYYMQRKLRRFIQIDRKLLEMKKVDNDKEKKANDFIIVHTEKDFNEKCSQNPQIKNVHYLIQDISNQNQFIWKKSYGPISTIKKYLIMNKECEESIDEEDIFHKNNEKVLIISAEPGMGKSLILDHFTHNSSVENFFIKIILNTCTKTLSDTNFKAKLQNMEDLIGFVLKSLLNKKDEQEISLLKHLAKEKKLILLFDGLDEVIDYKQKVIQLIDVLNRDCKLKKILITTRNHLKEELEDHFNTFSFNLNNFDDEDQKNFLAKYWRSLNLKRQERPTSVNKLMQTAEDLIKRIKSIPFKNLNQLIGIPLQTKMLADIYYEKVKNKEEFSNLILTNIAELYNEFIESKIKIQYEEKSKIEIYIDQDRFEEEKEKFYKNHIKLSTLILFENKNKKDEEYFKEKDEKRIIKYGVIVAFTNGIPLFLHQSYAEFFLAQKSLQKIKEQIKNDKELKEVLYDERHFLIRKFLNDLLKKNENQKEHKEKIKKDEKEDFSQEIENCCRENLTSLLKYFIDDNGAKLKTKNDFLIIASENGHKDIVVFLLEKGIDVDQQDEYGYTALMWASLKGHKEIVQLLLHEENIQINQQDKDGSTALMWASLKGHKEIVEILLQDKNKQINQQDKDGRTALILASEKGHVEIVEKLLQDKNIQINQQDKKYGATALIWASMNDHREIVQILLQDKKIQINKQDQYGYTAYMWATERGHKEIVQMLNDEDIKKYQKNIYGEFALITASRNGHTEIVQMLIQDKNIQINQQDEEGYTALMWASINGHKEIVQMLLQDKSIQINQQDKDGNTALILASQKGHTEIFELLLQDKNKQINQQDENGNTALMWASLKGHKEIVQMLLKDKYIQINLQDYLGYTALMSASLKGHVVIVKMLLQQENIRINQQDKDGNTALIYASRWGHKENVQLLLQEENIEINQQDEDGNTALMVASERGLKEIVKMLLKDKNIQINHQDKNGYTALMNSSIKGHKEIVQMLLQDKNILINQQDKDGRTALMWASQEDHREIVEILLKDENIQIKQQDKYGYTAIMWASFEVVEMLKAKERETKY
jgi:ankyrin repeat protein